MAKITSTEFTTKNKIQLLHKTIIIKITKENSKDKTLWGRLLVQSLRQRIKYNSCTKQLSKSLHWGKIKNKNKMRDDFND